MAESDNKKKYMRIRWFLLRFGLAVYDVFAVNLAYFFALLIRFYVAFEFNEWAVKYVSAFLRFAPYYTVACLVVFAAFGLYNSLWKYAGMNDMNRILYSSAITCVIQIAGTVACVMRMPLTYYALGAALQFVMITISRFSYRLLMIERGKFAKYKDKNAVNVLIVGDGESSRTVIKHLDRDLAAAIRPVCVVDVTNAEFQGNMGGVPVLGGIEKIPDALEKYQIARVVLADFSMSAEARRQVKEMCRKDDITVQDFSEYFHIVPSRIPLKTLLEYVEGPVELEIDRERFVYETGAKAMAEIHGKYIVSTVSAEADILRIKLNHDVLRPNDTQAEWVKTYREETGEDISFF